MQISRILRSKNWVAINLPLSKQLGLNAAFLFSHLCGLFEYYEERGELVEKDHEMYFYATIDTIAENTPLSRREQETAIAILEKTGLLKKKSIGMPSKRHFTIPQSAEEILYNILQFGGKRQTRKAENANTQGGKRQTRKAENANNINKELDLSNNNTFSNEKDSSEKTEVFSTAPENKKILVKENPKNGLFANSENQKEKEKNCEKKEKYETFNVEPEPKVLRAKFTKPTLEQVQIYCQVIGRYVDAERFIDHYTSNGWKVGKNPMKDWQAAVRTWANNNFNNNNQNNDKNAKNQSNTTAKPNAEPNADTIRRVIERDRKYNESGF